MIVSNVPQTIVIDNYFEDDNDEDFLFHHQYAHTIHGEVDVV